MKTQAIKVKLRDGEMGAYVAIPGRTPAGAIIAIMEIWGVNDTMRRHAHEFAQAGFVCLVPDLFWRQEPGVELSDHDPEHVKKAFDLYYDFDYDLAVRDMEDTWHFLQRLPECNGKVGAVGYCLGGKLCYLMCCRTDIDCAVAYYGTYIEHRIREAKDLHRPFVLHMALKDRWVQAEVNELLERRLSSNPLVTIHKYPGADMPSRATAARLTRSRRRSGRWRSRFSSSISAADNLSSVVPAKAGTHNHRPWKMDPRFRGGDNTLIGNHPSHHTLNRRPCRCSARNRPRPRSPSVRLPPAPS
jgi:carboxymethylenebutenolidase